MKPTLTPLQLLLLLPLGLALISGEQGCPDTQDADGDGYSSDVDCNDSDASIHPEAEEVCGDTIDSDCDGSDPACPPVDADNDGYDSSSDCDDDNPEVSPGSFDSCGDSIDDDCSGSATDCSPCPREMAIAGSACVDRWEAAIQGWSPYEVPSGGVATSTPGVVPQGYISGSIAQSVCQAAGKRLCTVSEWMRSCQGPSGFTYPYGNTYDPAACNDTYPGTHPVVDYFGTSSGVWDSTHMNDPGINQQPETVDLTGANPGCVSTDGIYDLHGNLHEWISDAAGTFKGGFYADGSVNGSGCTYTTTAHDFYYHDYSTGFRCCKNPVYP